MNSVAVITDIHANLPAFEAALARIEELAIDTVYCGGDLVGYGPQPNEVCALIQERAIPTIYGNYDYAIARDLDDCGCAYRDWRRRRGLDRARRLRRGRRRAQVARGRAPRRAGSQARRRRLGGHLRPARCGRALRVPGR